MGVLESAGYKDRTKVAAAPPSDHPQTGGMGGLGGEQFDRGEPGGPCPACGCCLWWRLTTYGAVQCGECDPPIDDGHVKVWLVVIDLPDGGHRLVDFRKESSQHRQRLAAVLKMHADE